jgi:hypothetical protein
MSWILAILGAIGAVLYGLYELGPGMNKRREKKKQDEWTKKWKDSQKGR